MEDLIKFLENYKSDLIDGVESGVNTSEEVAQIVDFIEEIEQSKKDMEYLHLHADKLIEQHKLQILNLFNSSCSNCIYVNKINSYTFICNNKNSPLDDKITDKNFWCNLGRVKK